MTISLLDNIAWKTLSGRHVRYSAGTTGARRYARSFSPIIGFPDTEKPDFRALSPFCRSGEHFYFEGWTGNPPAGWNVEAESTILKMVWAGDTPMTDEAQDATPLRPEHVARALELTALTRPGPFGPRTFELGAYFGYFDGDRLVAMAGERMFADPLREVSGVCTHPDFRGRGLARKLMMKLIRQELRRGETPFLHVMRENSGARSLYERMGFRTYRETVVRVVSPTQP
jgi:ribosomal protein S18 acetylase RimI-like enzyme